MQEAEVRDALIDLLGEAIGKENVITDNRQAQRVIDEVNGRVRPERISNKEVNKRFNEELDKFKESRLKNGVLHLGEPNALLRSSGLKASEITLTAKTLKEHLDKHGISIEEIKDLPNAINNPMMVYEWGTKAKSTIIITNITRESGDKITVAVKLERNGEEMTINEIASIHGKEGQRFISDMISEGEHNIDNSLKYVQENRKEVLDWLGLDSPKESASLTNEELHIAKVLQTFKNPAIIEQKNEKNLKEHRLVGGNSGYVGYSMSKRAEQAREEGRYPKTDFKKVYNISDKTLKALVSAGIIDDNEWHHTSTPIHEYTHLWAEALRKVNPKEWQNIVGLMKKQTHLWDKVKNDYPELKTDDEIADEVADKVLSDLLEGVNPNEVKSEEEKIIERAKADGTYMKAPNGKKSNLSERQWVQVRTKAFKKWFGDWELAARVINIVKGVKEHGFKSFNEATEWAKENIVKTYNSEETGGKGEIRISNGAITKYLSNSAVAKSDNKDVHLSVLKILPEVIKESIDAEQHFDYKKGEYGERRQENGENRDVVMHRLYGAVEIDGKIYRVKTTLKEFMYDKTEPKMPYSYEVTKIELLAGQNESTDKTALSRYSNNSITGAKLLQDVEKSHKKGEKLLDSSKIVDENGEPKVVYHGSARSFSVFDESKIGSTTVDDYHALRVMEDKVIEEMRKRDPKFRLHHSVYEQQIAAKAATQGQIFLFSQQTFKPLLDKVDKIKYQ